MIGGAAWGSVPVAALGLGCQVDNPLYTTSEAQASTSGASTSGVSTSGVSTGGASTGGATDASGTTTGGLACPKGTMEGLHPLAAPVENGLVVSTNSIEPCAWPTPDDVPVVSCDDYNLDDFAGGDLAASLVPETELAAMAAVPDMPAHLELMSPIFAIPDEDALVARGLSLAVRHAEPYPRPYKKGTYMVEALDNVEWKGAGLLAVVCAGP